MENQAQNCKKCRNTYPFLETGCDLCPDCVEKYPYFSSFIEEGFMGVADRTLGRMEVRSNKEPMAYAIDEIRFLFKSNQFGDSEKGKEFRKFREKWDFKHVSERELEEVKDILKNEFYDLSILEED